MGWTVGRAEKRVQTKANDRASVVQVYTAGLRFETEVSVDTQEPHQAMTGERAQHFLPLDCPLYDAPDGKGSLWTALWQVACLLRSEWSPSQWRPRLRRLARITGSLTTGEHVLAERMAEWVRRLLPASQMTVRGVDRLAIKVHEASGLDLAALETCRRKGGAMLVAWRTVHRAVDHDVGDAANAAEAGPTVDDLQWRVVAGLEGTQGSGLVFQPRSVLLLPQGMEAAWGCGYGLRLDPVVTREAALPEHPNLWQLRTLYGGWSRVEVVKVLMLDPS